MSMTGLAIYAGVAALGAAGVYLPRIWAKWRKGEGQARLDAYFDDAAANGKSIDEAMDDLVLREHLAKVRRLASEAVLADPEDWVRIMDKVSADVVKELGVLRSDLAKRLGKALVDLPPNHILLPDAWAAVEALAIEVRDFYTSPDRIAALAITRPS